MQVLLKIRLKLKWITIFSPERIRQRLADAHPKTRVILRRRCSRTRIGGRVGGIGSETNFNAGDTEIDNSVRRHCEASFAECLRYLERNVKLAALRREDDTVTIMKEQNWNLARNTKQVLAVQRDCQAAQRRDKLTAVPFQGPIGKCPYLLWESSNQETAKERKMKGKLRIDTLSGTSFPLLYNLPVAIAIMFRCSRPMHAGDVGDFTRMYHICRMRFILRNMSDLKASTAPYEDEKFGGQGDSSSPDARPKLSSAHGRNKGRKRGRM